jgi:hypothetical protein
LVLETLVLASRQTPVKDVESLKTWIRTNATEIAVSRRWCNIKSADVALNYPTTRRHTVVCRCYGTRRRITDAYERTLQKLSLVDRHDLQTEIIAAKKVIELGQRGVRDAG